MSKVTKHKQYSNPISGIVFRLPTLGAVLEKFNPEKHEMIKKLALAPGTSGVSIFTNLDKHSLQFGRHVAVMFGPACNIKKMEDIAQMTLGGDKTQGALFPCFYWEK